jgi:hypothetical protein
MEGPRGSSARSGANHACHFAACASSPTRAGEDGSLTQGTSGWAALRTPAIEEPRDDVQEAAL